MRKRLWAAAAALVILAAGHSPPALAEVTTASLRIFGGMGGGKRAALPNFETEDESESVTRSLIAYASPEPAGTIIVNTTARRLYLLLGDGQAMSYAVGVGREGFTWTGRNHVSRKAEWPDWRPPAEMIDREARRGKAIPAFMPGGPDNPLGARAIYIGDTEFRIHGTTQPWSIGQAVSSGCIRMLNADVIDLYDQVVVGALVIVE